MKEKILKFKETVLKTYSLKSRYTLKVMSKKLLKINNFNNLSFTSRYTLKIMSTGSERTSRFNLFPQIMESYLRQNRFKSISQKPGEILRQFSRINENELSSCKDVFKIIPVKSPRIFL